ncbi:MAG TPA: AAA family ATPase [Candidatus Deferrimicrobiaceae bacterium]|nr:AAA family ATPase [Candidatus Deferrimicrobiaceae bacterium]
MQTTLALVVPRFECERLEDALEEAGFGTLGGESVADLPAILSHGAEISIAIVDAGTSPNETVVAVRDALAGAGLAIPVLYLADDAHLEQLTAGLDEADEILTRPFTPDALRWRVEAMAIRSQMSPNEDSTALFTAGSVRADWLPVAPVYSVFNPKGGVGKTTIATSLAAIFRLHRKQEVLLVDADTVTGHVSLSLGINPGKSLSDQLTDERDGEPSRSLLDLAVTHGSGVRVVTLTNNPLTLDHLEAEQVSDAILAARTGVGAVIVDMHPSYSELNIALFAISDRILVPVTPDLPAMLAAVRLKEALTALGVVNRMALVANRANSGVPVNDIEKTLGLKAIGEIPSAGLAFVRAANAGLTVIEKFPKHKVVGDLDRLAEKLLAAAGQGAIGTSEHDPRALLRSLLGRRLPAQA